MGSTQCPKCGASNPLSAAKCGQCGRLFVSSGGVKMRRNYIVEFGMWFAVLAIVGAVFYFVLDEPTREKAFFKQWIDISRYPFDFVVTFLGKQHWMRHWPWGAFVVWGVIGGVVGGIFGLIKKR
jgi:hypothetical protein